MAQEKDSAAEYVRFIESCLSKIDRLQKLSPGNWAEHSPGPFPSREAAPNMAAAESLSQMELRQTLFMMTRQLEVQEIELKSLQTNFCDLKARYEEEHDARNIAQEEHLRSEQSARISRLMEAMQSLREELSRQADTTLRLEAAVDQRSRVESRAAEEKSAWPGKPEPPLPQLLPGPGRPEEDRSREFLASALKEQQEENVRLKESDRQQMFALKREMQGLLGGLEERLRAEKLSNAELARKLQEYSESSWFSRLLNRRRDA